MNLLLASVSAGNWLDATFQGFDMSVFRFLGNIQNDFLTVLAKAFTAMGEVKYTVLIGIVALILILFRRTRRYGLALLIAIAIGTLITNVVIKPMALRIRPYNTLQEISEYFGWYQDAGLLAESDYSFPSGHTTAATEIAVVLCLLFSEKKKKRIAWIFPVLAVLTACSRVYLMVHYASDVLAGMIIGLFAGLVGYFVSRAITRKWGGSFFWHRMDLERLYQKKTHKLISNGAAAACCILAWVIIFAFSFVSVLHAGGNSLRCSYSGEYKCYNEAQTGSKYPAIDGQYYCKIHWKELTEANDAD